VPPALGPVAAWHLALLIPELNRVTAGSRSSRSTPRPRSSGCAARGGTIPRLALTRKEAAAAIGMSLDSFERHVQPTLRLVRLGRMRLVPIAELDRWLSDNAERAV
jgi:hypothetical protein